MPDYTKSERRLLREVAGEVYEWELHRALEGLDSEFSRWRDGEILSSELSEAIHEFHQGAARELWSMYQAADEELLVARGIALGAVAQGRLPPTLLAKLEPAVRSYRNRSGGAV